MAGPDGYRDLEDDGDDAMALLLEEQEEDAGMSCAVVGQGHACASRLSRFVAATAVVAAGASVAMLAWAGMPTRRALQDITSLDFQSKYQHLDAWLFNGHVLQTGAAMSAGVPQAPEENMHDGNICADDEEMFDSLCYAKCSLLTQGTHPIRTSSFSCCKGHPCGYSNTKFSVKPCTGYDVAGDINGEQGACPHGAGTCLQDEELLLGMCYLKCAILTGGQYMHRLAATTCCSTTGLGCLNPANLKNDFTHFAVGGGKGDGNNATPAAIHMPMKALTEKSAGS